jgi:NAD(P)-dependent dehydrogenase (short-subunit alcohol dehydrogenase family)
MNKVVLVTGASSGLGEALASLLAQKEGYIVYGTSRKPHAETRFQLLEMDVQQAASVQAAVAQILAEQGKIDVLINNAGVGIAGPLELMSIDSIQAAFDTNVLGMIRTTQSVLPHMRKTQGGKIINISSLAAEVALPYRAVYAASKAAVGRITEALRLEVGRFGIQVCAIQCGDIQTPISSHRVMEYAENEPAYREVFARVAQNMNEGVSKGSTAEFMANEIIKIMEKPQLAKLYPVGKFYQKLSLILKRLLPGAWFERIIKGYTQS